MEPELVKGDADVRAMDAAAAALAKVPATIALEASDTLDKLAPVIQANIRRRARRHRQTGKLERLVSVKATGDGVDRVVRIHAGGRVAHLITGGTRPHDIRPLRAAALAIGQGPRDVAAAVRHPGTRADPFVAKGVRDSRPEIKAAVAATGRAVVKRVKADIGRS